MAISQYKIDNVQFQNITLVYWSDDYIFEYVCKLYDYSLN